MNKKEFFHVRSVLGKTQAQMAELLRTSPKAIQSYEQGWRPVPAHTERQILFLLSMKNGVNSQRSCWTIKRCPAEKKLNCPAWEFRAGRFCWFVNGTTCEGKAQRGWEEKMKICRSCKVMAGLMGPENPLSRRTGR